MFTDECGFQTKRMIINPERFLYSRANMHPNVIELLNRFHAQMEHSYVEVLRDDIQPKLRTTLEGRVAYHQECQERNIRQKTS